MRTQIIINYCNKSYKVLQVVFWAIGIKWQKTIMDVLIRSSQKSKKKRKFMNAIWLVKINLKDDYHHWCFVLIKGVGAGRAMEKLAEKQPVVVGACVLVKKDGIFVHIHTTNITFPFFFSLLNNKFLIWEIG